MAFAILITKWRRLNCCFLLLYDELCFTPFDINERGFFAVNNTEKESPMVIKQTVYIADS